MNLYSHKFKDASGNEKSLEEFKGKVLLIVNTASKCGFTYQYETLEELHEKYKDEGFSVIAFPCNQFGNQEPRNDEDIQSFCKTSFGVKFPVYGKIEVNGKHAHSLFRELKQNAPGLLGTKKIKWNFTKFLVSKDGNSVERFAPMTKPEKLEEYILKLLQSKN